MEDQLGLGIADGRMATPSPQGYTRLPNILIGGQWVSLGLTGSLDPPTHPHSAPIPPPLHPQFTSMENGQIRWTCHLGQRSIAVSGHSGALGRSGGLMEVMGGPVADPGGEGF